MATVTRSPTATKCSRYPDAQRTLALSHGEPACDNHCNLVAASAWLWRLRAGRQHHRSTILTAVRLLLGHVGGALTSTVIAAFTLRSPSALSSTAVGSECCMHCVVESREDFCVCNPRFRHVCEFTLTARMAAAHENLQHRKRGSSARASRRIRQRTAVTRCAFFRPLPSCGQINGDTV
jgi:hypothetical protein